MTEEVVVELKDVMRVFQLMEEMNAFFHQPMNYESADKVKAFANSYYPEVRELYYRVVWDWLPGDVQEKLVNR